MSSIELRIKQMHAALGAVDELDINAAPAKVGVSSRHFFYSVDFSDGISSVELANQVTLLLTGIGSLKDHYATWCKANGKPCDVKSFIRSDQSVAIIQDLWNRDKHPELKKSWSGLYPELRDVTRVMQLQTQAKKGSISGVFLNPSTMKLESYGDGQASLVIHGEVFDKDEQKVGDFNRIVKRAVNAWEQMLRRSGVEF